MTKKIVQRFMFGVTIPKDATFLFYDKGHESPLVYEVHLKDEKTSRQKDESGDVIEQVISYLNKVTGSKYTSRAKATTAHIRARLNEGRTLEDFMTVIDKKYFEWGEDPKWSKYLRPETLFGSKFDGYLSQKGIGDMTEDAFAELDAHLAGIS